MFTYKTDWLWLLFTSTIWYLIGYTSPGVVVYVVLFGTLIKVSHVIAKVDTYRVTIPEYLSEDAHYTEAIIYFCSATALMFGYGKL